MAGWNPTHVAEDPRWGGAACPKQGPVAAWNPAPAKRAPIIPTKEAEPGHGSETVSNCQASTRHSRAGGNPGTTVSRLRSTEQYHEDGNSQAESGDRTPSPKGTVESRNWAQAVSAD